MNGVIGNDSALYGYTDLDTTWANEMNFVMKYPRCRIARSNYLPAVQFATTELRTPPLYRYESL